jgi:hypothetical protein
VRVEDDKVRVTAQGEPRPAVPSQAEPLRAA